MPNTVALSHQILRIWPAFDLTERSSTAQCSAVGRWQIELAGRRELLATGLGDKLVVAPLLILVLYAGLIDLRGRTAEITLFEAAMPPQVGGSIVAIQYGLDLAHGGHRRRCCVSYAAGLVAGFRVFMSRGASDFLGSDA